MVREKGSYRFCPLVERRVSIQVCIGKCPQCRIIDGDAICVEWLPGSKPLEKRRSKTAGASSVEYAIIVSLIGAVIVLAVSLVGESLKPLFELAANLLP